MTVGEQSTRLAGTLSQPGPKQGAQFASLRDGAARKCRVKHGTMVEAVILPEKITFVEIS
jgi:hypothetical protein